MTIRSRATPFVLALLAALALAAVPPPPAGRAQAPQVPAVLEGAWRCAVSEDRARQIAIAAFEPTIAGFPSFIRGMVRERIQERLQPATGLEIELDGDRVRVTNIGRRRTVAETRLGGTTRVEGDDGEMRRVTQRLQGGWLEQVIEGESGTVHRLFSTEPDGRTLHADLTVQNERLGAPVRWRIDYRRR